MFSAVHGEERGCRCFEWFILKGTVCWDGFPRFPVPVPDAVPIRPYSVPALDALGMRLEEKGQNIDRFISIITHHGHTAR